MPKYTDKTGKYIHEKRLIDRDIDQLLGVCEFALQDGMIDQEEAEQILTWLNNHTTCLDTWPASVLYERLVKCLKDGLLDDDEERDLLDLVMSIARPPIQENHQPSSLPIESDLEFIEFEGTTFCFTGVFDFGTREQCISATLAYGGKSASGISKKVDYLVIGNVGSEFWKHTTFGNKIKKAIELKESGAKIQIVPETLWKSQLQQIQKS